MKNKPLGILLALTIFISLFPSAAFAAKTLGAKTTTELNLRKGAGTGYSQIMLMPKGKQVIVLSTSNGWSKVMVDNKIGYASAKYLSAQSLVSGSFGVGTITGSSVNMRKGAGTGYSVLETLNKGTQMSVTGASGNWYAVSFGGKTGYVSADYMTLSENKTATQTAVTYPGTVSGTDVRIRSGAGTGYSTIGYASAADELSVIGSVEGWYKISYSGRTGYISSSYVKILPASEYASSKDAEVKTATNLRMGPSTEFSVITKSPKDTALKLLGEYGRWYYAEQNGRRGYIPMSYVSALTTEAAASPAASSSSISAAGVVTGDSVRIRSGAGTGYGVLGYADTGDRLEIKAEKDGWYEIEYEGKTAYISRDYVRLTEEETSTQLGEKIVEAAKSYLGTVYVYGGSSPKGFDCSGFVYYLYGQLGYGLKRGAGGQYYNNGTAVKKNELQKGDLVFFSDDVDEVGHVGMYIGGGQFIHASSGKGCVCITDLDSYYYKEHYTGAKRIF